MHLSLLAGRVTLKIAFLALLREFCQIQLHDVLQQILHLVLVLQLLLVDDILPFEIRQEVTEVFNNFFGLFRALNGLVSLMVDVLRAGHILESFRRDLPTLDILSDVVHYDLFVVYSLLGLRLRLRGWLLILD